MLHHFNCASTSGNPNIGPLVFDWDDETGEVTGPSASEILNTFKQGHVMLHPIPRGSGKISSTKNRSDIAAVVGEVHHIPAELAGAYPQLEDDFDGAVRDLDGNIVGYVDF
jgi:hypothetical protein